MISSKFDAAASGRAEVPAAARIAEIQMAGQNAAAAVERDDRVLDVDVVNPVGERAHELDRIDPLPEQMAGIEVEAELLALVECLERPLGRVHIEGDFGRMHFQARTARRTRRRRRESDSTARPTVDSPRRSSRPAPAGRNRASARCSSR